MDVITIMLIVAFALVAIGVLAAILGFKKNQKETTEYFNLADTIPKKVEEQVKEELPDVFKSEVVIEEPIEIKEEIGVDEDSKPANRIKKREAKKPKAHRRSKLNTIVGKESE